MSSSFHEFYTFLLDVVTLAHCSFILKNSAVEWGRYFGVYVERLAA